jgi:quinol monooxygenase YgiN
MSESIVINANAFVSRWFLLPEKRDEFIRLFNQLWQADVEALKQATHFVFYGWGRDPNEFVAIESWKSEEIVGELRKSDFFQQSVSGLMACCSRPMEMQIFNGMEGSRELFDLYPKGPSVVHPTSGSINAVFQ